MNTPAAIEWWDQRIKLETKKPLVYALINELTGHCEQIVEISESEEIADRLVYALNEGLTKQLDPHQYHRCGVA